MRLNKQMVAYKYKLQAWRVHLSEKYPGIY